MSLEEARGYFGLFSCFVLPNPSLAIPSLPYRLPGGRVKYGNCARCMRENSETCVHTDPAVRGWATCLNSVDLESFLAEGSRVLQVWEIYDWGCGNKTTELFAPMIRSLIRKKVSSKEGIDLLDEASKKLFIERWAEIGCDLSGCDFKAAKSVNMFAKVSFSHLGCL